MDLVALSYADTHGPLPSCKSLLSFISMKDQCLQGFRHGAVPGSSESVLHQSIGLYAGARITVLHILYDVEDLEKEVSDTQRMHLHVGLVCMNKL